MIQQQQIAQIKTLPFDHNANNFWQAIGITNKELSEAILKPEEFYSLNEIDRKLRILSTLIFTVIKGIIKLLSGNVLSVLFVLICDFDKKSSEVIEIIERNLIIYAKNENKSLEDFDKFLNVLFEKMNSICLSQYCYWQRRNKNAKDNSTFSVCAAVYQYQQR